MKAISLWQPYASAIALRLKTIETRSWATRYRGRIAIHASKRWAREQREFAAVERALGRLPERLPFGCIVALATIVDCSHAEDLISLPGYVGPVNKIYGDFSDGRFGWELSNVIALPEPIPYKGAQGFFTVPDHLFVGVS